MRFADRRRTCIAIICLILLPALSGANSPATPISFQDADQAFKERGQKERALFALQRYRELHDASPTDSEAGWRLAMACYFVGLRWTQDSDKKEALFKEGRDAALNALKSTSSCAACHFWAAINMALYGQEVGVFKTLSTLSSVREHLKATIAIDPLYASAGAYRLLGAIDEKLPGILGGDDDRARSLYQKAIELAPDEPLNYLFLAKILDERFHDHDSAEKIAKRGSQIQALPAERLESIEALAELKKYR